jgi:prolyl 4-hydroxylase
LRHPEGEDELWCQFADCDRPYGERVTFKPIAGNAVFWMNLKDGGKGEGDLKTLHAGLPVTSGTKMGLNIWTWTKKR